MAAVALLVAATASGATSSGTTILGVHEDTAVALGPVVPAEAKFAGTSTFGATEHRKLLAPVAKKAAKIVVAKPTSRTQPSGSTRLSGSWRQARVSWYGPGFYGNGMAGGGKLTKTSMVCAHRTLPFGTKVQFSYKGRKVTAVVKDRGPFIAGRVFDLGPGTAKALKFSGVGMVGYRIVK